ncbi:MAG TPA: tRNA (N6-threonylcarbamoyladenosine(37)-N6)-methyltransferase TrmO [Methanocella sp.]|nr:tRNA (N6-threonylcarbamoyladenosine(37)-N6)-methyltransferase TrmO [Methanocella sp.]
MTLSGIRLRQIGVVRSDVKERKKMPLQGVDATVEVFPEYEQALDGIDDHSHVFVLCWLHEADRDALKVVPRKFAEDFPEKGVFSVRSPVRPNPVSLAACELISRDGPLLRVANMDAIDGTPVIDIKPYEPGWDCIFSARSGDRTEKLKRLLPTEVRDDLIREAYNYHGERCTGLALAVRMATFAGQRLGCDLRRADVCILIGKNHCTSDSLIGITGARLGNDRLYYNLNPRVTRYKDSYSIYTGERTIVFHLRRFMKDFDTILECNISDLFDIEVL